MQTKQLFEILVREHASMLLTYIRSMVDSNSAVDDIFQDTMITAWKRLDDFDPGRPFAPWLRGIAKNHMLNYFRKTKRDMLMCNDEILHHVEEQIQHISVQAGDTWEEKTATLTACIDELPSLYQQAIRLRYLEEKKPAQIKDQLNVGKEALKKRLQRAKSALLDCMKRKGTLLSAEEVSK